MSFVDAFENAVLDAMLGTGATLLSANVKIGLSTSTPTDSGTNITEPSFSYAKVTVANNDTKFPAASGGAKSNGEAITFPTASGGDWGTITHWVLYNDSDVAKIWGTLDDGAGTPQPRAVYDGDTFSFPATQLRITLD